MPARNSAALLAFHSVEGGGVRVFLGHMGGPFWATRDDGAWSIPKGEFDPAMEGPLDVAKREFTEEIGVPAPEADPIDLGVQVMPSGKRVRTFAVAADESVRYAGSNEFSMEWPRGSGILREFPEIDRADWFPLAVARRKVVSGQVPILDALVRALNAHAGPDEDLQGRAP